MADKPMSQWRKVYPELKSFVDKSVPPEEIRKAALEGWEDPRFNIPISWEDLLVQFD